MICHYFSFLIDEIWLDWWNNILLFLFSALTELNLICGIWAFSIIQDRPLGSCGPGLHFELASGEPGTHHFFGLGEWAGKPIFLTLSMTIKKYVCERVRKLKCFQTNTVLKITFLIKQKIGSLDNSP